MEIKLAETAGFCFGVKRAVEKVYEQINKNKNRQIYTYGPIIHNEEVVRDLEEKGVRVIESADQLKQITDGIIVIRSHGVSRAVYHIIEEQNLECVDATCPFVKRIHNIVKKESAEGKQIIIVGNQGHPEVEGITGWSDSPVFVVESAEEAEKISGGEACDNGTIKTADREKPYCIVSQTTFNYNNFQDVVEIFREKGYNSTIVNTICNATEERQREAGRIAAEADAMIVIGGKHSSNTRKLYEICSQKCASTYLIQTLKDLHLKLPETATLIGITAGASTPNNIIEEVQNYVRINF